MVPAVYGKTAVAVVFDRFQYRKPIAVLKTGKRHGNMGGREDGVDSFLFIL